MQEMRAEYKLLIGLGIIFTFILLFFLLKTNYFQKISNKYKESKLVTCNDETSNKGIEPFNSLLLLNIPCIFTIRGLATSSLPIGSNSVLCIILRPL